MVAVELVHAHETFRNENPSIDRHEWSKVAQSVCLPCTSQTSNCLFDMRQWANVISFVSLCATPTERPTTILLYIAPLMGNSPVLMRNPTKKLFQPETPSYTTSDLLDSALFTQTRCAQSTWHQCHCISHKSQYKIETTTGAHYQIQGACSASKQHLHPLWICLIYP